MIPRFRPDLGMAEILAALRFGGEEDVRLYEQAFARQMGQRHAISFPYGRTGLMLLLEALGLQDKEIICPAYTCVVVPHAIVKSGNHPVFVDSQVSDCNMDLELAEAAIGPRTGALIATSIFGHPVDLDRLDAISARYPGLIIVQDCAHGFAAEWRGRPVQQAGRAAIFGLNISKISTSIFGGMVTTNDDALAARIRQLREHRQQAAPASKGPRRVLYLLAAQAAFSPPVYGAVRWLERHGALDRFSRYYDEGRIDLPVDALVALTPVEARVGQIQIRKYTAMIEARRRWATHYRKALAEAPGLRFPEVAEGATWSHVAAFTTARDALVEYSQRHGVQLGTVIDYNIPEMTAYRDRPDPVLSWPVASNFSRSTINLPVTGTYHEDKAKIVVKVVTSAIQHCSR